MNGIKSAFNPLNLRVSAFYSLVNYYFIYPMEITQEVFGTIGQKPVYIFKIIHSSGATIRITNYGATWVSAIMPDKNGVLADVLLGYNNLAGYVSDTSYMGSTVGRFANRIANARFTLNGRSYALDKNDGENCNHGGFSGIHKQVFESEISGDGVIFSMTSPDGEGGFPGNVILKVSYTFTDDLKVKIHYWATTDQDTYLNLTNHAYFNLAGSGSMLQHQLQIPSTMMLETNEQFIPTGKIIPVQDTVFDFTEARILGTRIHEKNQQLIWNKGYNHCYPVHNSSERDPSMPVATLSDPLSGRRVQLFTTLPSVLIYSAGFLSSQLPGKSGTCYQPFEGICLEAQYYPDAPNHAHFPSCLLRKNEVYDHSIEYHFSAE
ncbi:MAG: galactose mutarotase [Paludibacter sp.]|nr:galactose mutarotase [Paludibacter sp.]